MASLHTLAVLTNKELQSSFLSYSAVKESSGIFCHYCMDGNNDVGWGCGYRSLQSLCSWAVNNSTSSNETIPSLRKIQDTLVEVGDKPDSFIDSKEWIGCYEASIVLDQLFKVPCKLLHVQSGRDIPSVCEQLEYHFNSTGSPVMIGGDVDGASKTLIGIAKDRNNEWKFLIADPHYIGSDDSTRIIEDQGTKWHDTDLYEHASFYNFCIPIKEH